MFSKGQMKLGLFSKIWETLTTCISILSLCQVFLWKNPKQVLLNLTFSWSLSVRRHKTAGKYNRPPSPKSSVSWETSKRDVCRKPTAVPRIHWGREAVAEQSNNASLKNDQVEEPTMKEGKQRVCKYLSVRTFRISQFQQRSSQVLHKGPLEAAVAGHENCLLLSTGWRKCWAKLKFT